MGRRSALTPEQWIEVERRHLIGGESINSLAKEFGVDESAIRRKINPNKSEGKSGQKPLRDLVIEKIRADKVVQDLSDEISELPMSRQKIASDLYRKLSNTSESIASATEIMAKMTHQIAIIAHEQVAFIDPVSPLEGKSGAAAKNVMALTQMVNETGKLPINLLNANKDRFKDDGDDDKSIRVIGGLPEKQLAS